MRYAKIVIGVPVMAKRSTREENESEVKDSVQRGTKSEVFERRREIVLQAIKCDGVVRFQDVKELYGSFANPVTKFQKEADNLNQWLEDEVGFILRPLGFSIPKLTRDGDTVRIPIRNFAQLLLPDIIEPKQRLAEKLLDRKSSDGEFLVPRKGGLFLGIGSTMCELAKQIIARREQFKRVHIYTQNFELATEFNFAAPKGTRDGHFSLRFPGLRLDFDRGCLIQESEFPRYVKTAILGIKNISEDKEIFTVTPEAWPTTEEYLKRTKRTIVVVADESKNHMDGDGQYVIKIPEGPDDRKAYFVTDEAYKTHQCPKGFKHVLLK